MDAISGYQESQLKRNSFSLLSTGPHGVGIFELGKKKTESMFTKHLAGVPSGVSVKKEGENKTPQNKQKKKNKKEVLATLVEPL